MQARTFAMDNSKGDPQLRQILDNEIQIATQNSGNALEVTTLNHKGSTIPESVELSHGFGPKLSRKVLDRERKPDADFEVAWTEASGAEFTARVL